MLVLGLWGWRASGQLPSADPAQALSSASGQALWSAMIRGRNIKAGDVLVCAPTSASPGDAAVPVHVEAHVEAKSGADALVRLYWHQGDAREELNLNLAEVLHHVGDVPLPPYMKRQADQQDLESYQTPHASCQGSVAAPTAGLHFSRQVVAGMRARGVQELEVTLHVGAGTFRPVDGASAAAHTMHAEWISVSAAALTDLRAALASQRPVVPVGTTSVRTLESVYWWGVKLLLDDDAGLGRSPLTVPGADSQAVRVPGIDDELSRGPARAAFELAVSQWDPYRLTQQVCAWGASLRA